MWFMWHSMSYVGYIKENYIYFFKEPLDYLYPSLYPIVIAITILLEFLFKKVNKLSIIFNYILITVYLDLISFIWLMIYRKDKKCYL